MNAEQEDYAARVMRTLAGVQAASSRVERAMLELADELAVNGTAWSTGRLANVCQELARLDAGRKALDNLHVGLTDGEVEPW